MGGAGKRKRQGKIATTNSSRNRTDTHKSRTFSGSLQNVMSAFQNKETNFNLIYLIEYYSLADH